MSLRNRILFVLLTLLLSSLPLFAQGASTANLSGEVTDPSGAVVAGAEVILTDIGSNASQMTTTNQSGHYSFSFLQPGNYRLTVKKEKFRQVVTEVTVSVGIAAAQNVKLEIGASNEVVEVKATGQELQSTDASVGNVMTTIGLEDLPSLSRDVAALLQIQPMAAPSYNASSGVRGTGETNTMAGGVAGALADQNTFHLDGGDATSNTEGDAGYANGQEGAGRAGIPTPVESIEEFRVTTNNSNTFARSSGADVQMVTRKGTNSWHGAAYEFNQNRGFNSNLYELKLANEPRPPWHDNRYGFRVGGPVLKDKAFFFLMYEGRKFTKGSSFTRDVPSALMRQGILQFPASPGGPILQYNFNPANGPLSTACIGGPCDPRGLGISPVISQIWNTEEPVGNNANEGDGLNTIGFDSTVPVTSRSHDGIARFDYNLSKNWTINATARYFTDDALQDSQIDIGGITGGKLGVPKSVDQEPVQPRYYVLGLTGRLSPNITNDAHFDFFRYFWQWRRRDPFPQVAGLGAALQIYAESNTTALVPLNVDTQNARSRIWDGIDYNLNDDVSWLHGTHLIQFGGAFRHQNFFHIRNDKVVGGLSVPIYFADYNPARMTIPNIPVAIDPGQLTNYYKAYAATLGMLSNTAQLLTRAPDLSPNPPGTPNKQRSLVDYYDLHIVDTWKMRPTLTVSYGLDWGVQTPPYETNGLQTIMVYGTNPKATVTYANYMAQVQAAALQGNVFVPELGFAPIRTTGRKYPSDMDWHNFAPRFSIAWNPRGSGGFLDRLFGDGKSVVRAGYGRYFDRLNGVGLVMTPALGIGFGNGVACKAITSAQTCSSTVKNDPTTAFRIGPTSGGWDGETAFIPSLTTITPPVVPGATADANTPYQLFDFRIDPKRKVGVEDTWTLGIQRQLRGNLMMEVGYVGRVGHHLYTTNDINQIPYMLTLGGQTFASAYDAIQRQLLSGVAPGAVTSQPFFDNASPKNPVPSNYACTPPACTAAFVSALAGSFAQADTTTIYDSLGLTGPLGSFDALPLDQQFEGTQMSTSMGDSIYNAGYASLRGTTHGLTMQFNYTYSHSSDDAGLGQANVFISPTDGFNRHRDYETSYFDRRNVFTGFFVYELPFGKGHTLSGNGFVNRVVGGWKVSSAITTSDGVPQRFTNCTFGDELGDGYLNICSSWVPTGPAGHGTFGIHNVNGTLNAFANPAAVLSSFRQPLFSDPQVGGQPYRGLHRFSMDAGLTKNTMITEQVGFDLYLQAINVLNHIDLQDLTPDNPFDFGTGLDTFGALTKQYNSQRYLNIGIRVTF